MGRRAHPAKSLGDLDGIPGITADKDLLKSAVHTAGHSGIHNNAVFDFHLGFEMPFNPCDRIDADFYFFSAARWCGSWFTA
jgi:hypothetical protein